MANREQVDRALALWSAAARRVESDVSEDRQSEYEATAHSVRIALLGHETVEELVDAYRSDTGRAEANETAQLFDLRLDLDVVEDYGYFLRYRELV